MSTTPAPVIRYPDVSFIKIAYMADETMGLTIVYNKGCEYFRFKPEHYGEIFAGRPIEDNVETDFYYDDEGAADEKSKAELDQLISWCTYAGAGDE